MSSSGKKTSPAKAAASARTERLAAQLRANLIRRKEKARGTNAGEAGGDGSDGARKRSG